MEVIVEKIIDDMLFKKDSWFKRFLRRLRCQSKCCIGSSCELEPEEVKEEKQKQKQEILDFVKIIKKNSMTNASSDKAEPKEVENGEEEPQLIRFKSSHI